MLLQMITPGSIIITVTFLAVQAISYQSSESSCNLVTPLLLAESRINPSGLVRCADLSEPSPQFAPQCHPNSRNVMYCSSPIVVRRNPVNNATDAASNATDSLFTSGEALVECQTRKRGKCTRTFYIFIEEEVSEIPKRLDLGSIYPTITNNISLISLAHCNLMYEQNILCSRESETVIVQPSDSLVGLLNRYAVDDERKVITGLKIINNSCTLRYQNSPFEPFISFRFSLEDMVSYSVFSSVPQLAEVQIQNITLKRTPPDLFISNSKLKRCVITHTMLEEVHPELFTSTRELETVNFSDNRLQTLPENLFQNNVRLRTLILARNDIRYLPTNFSAQSRNLSILDLSGNQLQVLQLSVFTNPPETTYANFTGGRPLPATFTKRFRAWVLGGADPSEILKSTVKTNTLAKIDVSHNRLRKIPDEVFDGSITLTIFRANRNKELRHLTGSHMFYALQELSVSDCSLTSIDENFFAKQHDNNPLFVKKIDLSRNELENLHAKTFWNCFDLEVLLLNRNRLHKLEGGLFKDLFNLRMLDVSGNLLSAFHAEALNLRSIMHLNFDWNSIAVFDPIQMMSLFESINGFEKRIDLSHNCLTTKKIKLPSVNDTRKLYLKYISLRYTPLKANDTIQGDNRFLVELDEAKRTLGEMFKHQYDRNEIEQLVLRMKFGPTEENINLCPNPFKQFCTHFPLACGNATNAKRQATNQIFRYLNFSRCEEVTVEDNSSEDALECSFTPTCLPSHYKWILSSVTRYYDKDSSFICPVTTSCPSPCGCYKRAIENQIVVNCSDRGLSQLPTHNPLNTKVLYFDHNKLQSLVGLYSSKWSDLSELYLENNLISSITKDVLPPKLELISLRSNKIESINKSDLDILNDKFFFLSNNPWKCDCNALLLKAKLGALNNVLDAKSMLCASSNISILNTPDSVLCPVKLLVSSQISLAASLGIILPVMAGILIFFYYRNKELVEAYMFTNFPFIFRFSRSPRDKRFDAFVSYCSYDRDIAMQMIEELENKEPRYRLCIHERDWLPGNQITTNIAKSVSSSRKAIFILSMEFIRSIWLPVELNAVYHQMLEDKKNYAIIVIKGDIPPTNELDEHLQILLKTKTYLVWGEHWFWEKLRYALYQKVRNEGPLNNGPTSDKKGVTKKDVLNTEITHSYV